MSNTLRPPVPENCDPDWRSLMERCWAAEPLERPTFTEIANKLRSMASKITAKAQTPATMTKPNSQFLGIIKQLSSWIRYFDIGLLKFCIIDTPSILLHHPSFITKKLNKIKKRIVKKRKERKRKRNNKVTSQAVARHLFVVFISILLF